MAISGHDARPAGAMSVGRTAAGTPRGPCGPARAAVDTRCAEADRLARAARSHAQALDEAKQRHFEIARQRDADAKWRDRRWLTDEKERAQTDYHAQIMHAADQRDVHDAAAGWLGRLDQLNRQARLVEERADRVAQQAAELDGLLAGLELAADAARISAEAAQAACLEARRALAACEEEAQRRVAVAPASGATASAPAATTPPPVVGSGSGGAAIRKPPDLAGQRQDEPRAALAARALMRGDRQALLGLALRLSEESGMEAGRLQLLLLELREHVNAGALADFAFAHPPGHPFWSQFSADDARNVAASLAAMGYRFDGRDGWLDRRAPQVRDLALALSYCGFDPRTLRRPAGQAAIDALWQGTVVSSEQYLLAHAPTLEVTDVVALLGSRAGRLGELWDIWGRVRPLLMRGG